MRALARLKFSGRTDDELRMRAVDRLHDAHRLSVLHDLDILDTVAEPAYDDLARLASICCDSKIAAVNFVDDDRHWTKAIVGVEGGQGASLSAGLSFCAATVASADGQLSVPDTQRSERWRSHPLVAEGPTVGFYAGASIVVADEPIGVVCVFGHEPRPVGEREQQALRALARQASAQLELRMRDAHLSELAVKDPLTVARTAGTFGDMRSLARSSELLEHNQLILDAAGDGICGLNRDGIVTFANPAAAALTGYAIDELVGRNLHETVHHSRADGSPYPFEECPGMASLRDGTVHHVDDDVYWSKDGSGRPVEFTSTPIVTDGAVTGAVMVFKDITERKAAGAALRASEHRTREILQTAHDAFVAMDCDGLITDWNPQAQASFGWSRDEVLGHELAETIIPERDRAAHRRGLARFLATGEGSILGQRLQLRALHRDGHEFAIELTISPLQSADGWSFNAFARDITERTAAEQLLERQRQQLLEAQVVGGFGSWEWDIVSDTIEWSDELCRMYGLPLGSHPQGSEEAARATHPEDRALWQASVQASLQSGEPLDFEFRAVRPDGSTLMAHSRGEVIFDAQGTPVRMVGTAQDITERHELERVKDEFTSVVSHELRTPLTSIRGSLGLLESGVLGELPAQGQRMVEIAVQNTDRLVRLINDILDIERINSGQIDMHPQSCDARELIDRACDAVTSLADAASVSVVIEAERLALSVDADRIIQTLTNLISNAVKFSPPDSSVHVSCSRRDAEVLFEVSDEGRGIPAEKLESIFGRFAQVDASDSREKGGTGLGLAICRSIVDQHGGRIWAHSEPGQGATFSFVLPAPGTGAASDRRSIDADELEVVADADAPLVWSAATTPA